MRYPLCRVTLDADPSAQVLVDLNEGRDTVWLDGGSKGSPLGAPDVDKGERSLQFELVINQSAEWLVVEIARSVQRKDAWLMWQRNQNSEPVWFKLLGTPGGALDMSLMFTDRDGFYRWSLELAAEAFAYGARVSETVNLSYRLWNGTQDTDLISAKLAPVKGDAPARVRIEWKPDDTTAGWSPWFNVTGVPRGTWATGPTMWQAEAFSPQTGYTRQEIAFGGPDPTTGNPYNVLKTNGTQNTQYGGAPCLSGTAPSVPAPGRYVMMLRLITSTTGAIRPSFRWGITGYGSSSMMFGMWRTWNKPAKGSGFAGWLALDSFQLPAGVNPTGLTIDDTTAPTLTLWHQGDGVNADVYIDKVLLVPAELATGVAHNITALALNDGFGASSNSIYRVDDMVDRVGITTKIDNPPKWFSTAPPKVSGGFPYVTPGLDNWFTFLPNVDTGGYTDDLVADQFEVTLSYHPRYLHLAAA